MNPRFILDNMSTTDYSHLHNTRYYHAPSCRNFFWLEKHRKQTLWYDVLINTETNKYGSVVQKYDTRHCVILYLMSDTFIMCHQFHSLDTIPVSIKDLQLVLFTSINPRGLLATARKVNSSRNQDGRYCYITSKITTLRLFEWLILSVAPGVSFLWLWNLYLYRKDLFVHYYAIS